MSSHTPNVVVLLGQRGPHGIWRFLFHHPEYFGVPLQVNLMETQISQRVRDALNGKIVDADKAKITMRARVEPLLSWPGGGKSLLLLAECPEDTTIEGDWRVLPDILRQMPRSRNRVTFMKVFQHLTAHADEECDALELTKDVVASLFPQEP